VSLGCTSRFAGYQFHRHIDKSAACGRASLRHTSRRAPDSLHGWSHSQTGIGERWPMKFDRNGSILAARWSKGLPFVFRGEDNRFYFAVTCNLTLLCGAGYNRDQCQKMRNRLTAAKKDSLGRTDISKARRRQPFQIGKVLAVTADPMDDGGLIKSPRT
jgi:hypothetical protein